MRRNHIELKFEVQKRVVAGPLTKVSVRVCKGANFFHMQWKEMQQIVCEPPAGRQVGRHAYTYGDIGHFYALVLGSNVCDKFYIYTLNAGWGLGAKSVTNCGTL
jgi:hypothetical protein